jgi:hypothetical protein
MDFENLLKETLELTNEEEHKNFYKKKIKQLFLDLHSECDNRIGEYRTDIEDTRQRLNNQFVDGENCYYETNIIRITNENKALFDNLSERDDISYYKLLIRAIEFINAEPRFPSYDEYYFESKNITTNDSSFDIKFEKQLLQYKSKYLKKIEREKEEYEEYVNEYGIGHDIEYENDIKESIELYQKLYKRVDFEDLREVKDIMGRKWYN